MSLNKKKKEDLWRCQLLSFKSCLLQGGGKKSFLITCFQPQIKPLETKQKNHSILQLRLEWNVIGTMRIWFKHLAATFDKLN